MTIARKLTAITTAAALAATAMVPLTTAASAEGWRDGHRGGRDYAYSDRDRRDAGRNHRRERHARRHHRRHHDNTGKYIAIGVGALVLGAILSDAARH